MSTGVKPRRHALGLPAGSIRALLTIVVVGLTCSLMWLPPLSDGRPRAIPPYLIYLVFIIIGHYFNALGRRDNPDEPSALYLPSGTVRLLVIVALLGTIGWKAFNDATTLEAQYRATLEAAKAHIYLPALLLAGFFAGVIVRFLLTRNTPLVIIHDIQAWLSLLALVGLVISSLIYLVINPSRDSIADVRVWEDILAVLVAFYFGARS